MQLESLPFAPEVLEMREKLFFALRTLPGELSQVAETFLQRRINQGTTGVMLGEYAPWFLADLYQCNKGETLDKFVLAWLHVYIYTLMIDDHIDQERKAQDSRVLIASGLILERGLREVVNLYHRQRIDMSASAWEADMDSLAIATCRELEQRNIGLFNFSLEDLATDADKVKMINICLRFLKHQAPAIMAEKMDWDHIKHLFTAMQLLDDITDYQEDWKKKHWTYPLGLMLSRFAAFPTAGHRRLSAMNADTLDAAMILSGTLRECVLQATKSFEMVAEDLKPPVNSKSAEYLHMLIAHCTTFLESVEQRENELRTCLGGGIDTIPLLRKRLLETQEAQKPISEARTDSRQIGQDS